MMSQTEQEQLTVQRIRIPEHNISYLKPLKKDKFMNFINENQNFLSQECLNKTEDICVSIDTKQQNDHKFYPNHLGYNNSWLSKFFFLHYTSYALLLRSEVLNKRLKITDKHLPKLSPEDDLIQQVQKAQNKIQKLNLISFRTLVKLIFFGELKWITGKCIVSYVIESVSKNGISLIMSFVIGSVSQHDYNNAHFYGIILVILNFICLLSRHHAANYSMVFSTKARLSLINLVYIKLIGLNSYSFKQANIGKILNIISGDINTLEQMFSMIFPSSVVIISMLFACFILWNRFDGIIGLLAVLLLFLAYPIQIIIQSYNQETLKQAKLNQDQRLRITNQFIEGIRLIKMQAWEKAFQTMILMKQKQFDIFLLKIKYQLFQYFSLILKY